MMKKEKEKLCRPISKGDVSLDLMHTLTEYAARLEKEYFNTPPYYDENYTGEDKDLYETKVD